MAKTRPSHDRSPPKLDEKLDTEAIWKGFNEAVNMTPAELEAWLDTEESRSAGWAYEGDRETVGHHSGRRIVEIKRARRVDLDDEDYRHMRKVIGFVHRHLAQGGPEHDREDSRWRYSLMNWGHDPLKK